MAPSFTSTSPSRAPRSKKHRVLLIDGDFDFRSGLAEILRDDGYAVTEFDHPAKVPPFAELGVVDLMIIGIPVCCGDAFRFIEHFHAQDPDVPIVVITAFCGRHLVTEVARRPYVKLFRKPLEYGELRGWMVANVPECPAVSRESRPGTPRPCRPS